MLMRGGTSKGGYFLAGDLPGTRPERDDLLLRIMGSGDPRQIDGLGGGHTLTSKVAIISRADDLDADLDYLFLQLGVDEATVSDQQNCGNLLAGVGPFAVERGLMAAGPGETTVRIRMVNSGSLAVARFATPGGRDTREDILRAADICLDHGVFIETGPHKHAIQQTFFLYVYEPGGNRIELCNPVARLIFAPDWPVITWTEAERAKGQAWGLKTIESFHTHGTPPVT